MRAPSSVDPGQRSLEIRFGRSARRRDGSLDVLRDRALEPSELRRVDALRGEPSGSHRERILPARCIEVRGVAILLRIALVVPAPALCKALEDLRSLAAARRLDAPLRCGRYRLDVDAVHLFVRDGKGGAERGKLRRELALERREFAPAVVLADEHQ